jgi:hypothetical protein
MADAAAPKGFEELLAELSDGEGWLLIRADGWEEFVEGLSEAIVQLSLRRRQAIVMVLFAFAEGLLTPELVSSYLAAHEVDSDEGVAALIEWLRQFKPKPDR